MNRSRTGTTRSAHAASAPACSSNVYEGAAPKRRGGVDREIGRLFEAGCNPLNTTECDALRLGVGLTVLHQRGELQAGESSW